MFNEGAYATSGEEVLRLDLSAEAIRLARLLADVMPDDPETLALLALFLFIEARRDARVDSAGAVVLMTDQDRSIWDRALIDEATTLIDRAQIVLLYESLHTHRPTPIVALNHAVATAMYEGPQAGLDLMGSREISESLDRYHYLHSARAELLRRLGDESAAVESYSRALALVTNDAERQFLSGRLRTVGSTPDRSS